MTPAQEQPPADAAERPTRGWGDRRQPDAVTALVSAVQDYAIFVLDAEGNVASWNAGAQRFNGYEPQEIIGRHVSVFYLAEDVAAGQPQRELETAAADGQLEGERWRIRKDGSRFWANVVITALRDRDGTLLGYGKVIRDVTARVAGERRLHDRERQLADAQSLAGVGSWEWALAEPTITFSDEMCRLVGMPTGSRPVLSGGHEVDPPR